MKLIVFSDCHFEFHRDAGKSFVGELAKAPDAVAVVAGDVAVLPLLLESLRMLCQKFRHVVYVAGNHEFYGCHFSDIGVYKGMVSQHLPNLHWLERETAEIDGRRFVGTTLWFPPPPGHCPKWALNDYHQIGGFEPWVYDEHEKSLEFLEAELRPTDILVTHHFPFSGSIARQHKNSNLNPFFHAGGRAESLVAAKGPFLAIHGHTHTSFSTSSGPTRIVCNPHGYPGENPEFDYARIVDLPDDQ